MSILLSHYWTADDDPLIRQAQLKDWINDLCDFPIVDIIHACEEWRRAQTKRPTIADIRKILLQWQTESRGYEPRANNSVATAPREIMEARRYAEAREARHKWAVEHGCRDFAHAMEVGLQAVGRGVMLKNPIATMNGQNPAP